MVKRIFGLFICILLVMSSGITVFAASAEPTEIIYLEDGSYIEITIVEEQPTIQPFGATKTRTSSKIAQAKNSSGTKLWYVKVTGTFSYNGTSSSCTKSTVTASAQHASWSISSKNASKSGSTAKASATAVKKLDGTVTDTMSRTVSLTCNKDGKLS